MKNMKNYLKYSVALLAASGFASQALASVELADSIDRKLNSIELRHGLELGIGIKSLFQSASFSSPQQDSAMTNPAFTGTGMADKSQAYGAPTTPNVERVGFTQLDLSLLARPWDQARANVILRFVSGYQDYFNTPTRIISVPWMDVDGRLGKAGNQVHYQFGDYRGQISPLTLWAPGVEILYEPEVYRRKRHMGSTEMFLDSTGARNLQGGEIAYRGEVGAFEPRVELYTARLRKAEQLDRQGAVGNLVPASGTPFCPTSGCVGPFDATTQIIPNSAIDGASQSGNMDKIMLGANLEGLGFDKAAYVGGSYLDIRDLKSSMVRVSVDTVNADSQVGPLYDRYAASKGYYVWNPQDTDPQLTSVISVRAGVDGARLLKDSNMVLSLSAEYAMSKNRVGTTDQNGAALLAQFSGGYGKPNKWLAHLDLDYLQNNEKFFNNLAQSPSFIPHRILNIDKDPQSARWGSRSPLYSTFDALYNFNPKYSPTPTTVDTNGKSTNDLGTDLSANTQAMSGAESYEIAPMNKNSYTTAVLTQKELKLVNSMSDPTLQDALPNGLATANRKGPRLRLTAGALKDTALELTVLYSGLSQSVAENLALGTAKYTDMGGGLKVRINSLGGWELPLEMSGSYTISETKYAVGNTTTSNFLNAGVYGKFHKRFGAFAGLQMIDLKRTDAVKVSYLDITKSSQSQWMAGLDYALEKNMWVSVGYGIVNTSNTYENNPTYYTVVNGKYVIMGVDAGGQPVVKATLKPDTNPLQGAGYMLPDYYYVSGNTYTHAFQQSILEASVNVDF